MADHPAAPHPDRTPARAFGTVADAYDRGRPGYPREAAAWLTDLGAGDPVTVLEVGAGTGKLTEQLVALGHDVLATDPDPEMLAVLGRRLPDVRTAVAPAEDLPLPDASVDVVVCAQAFHWLDPEVALPEIARVLRPGGHLALVWNERDERIPWVRRLGRLLGGGQRGESHRALVHSPLFGFVEDRAFRSWQTLNRSTVQDLALSRSHVATRDDTGREELRAQVLAFYDDYGRGMDGMQLPYVVQCFRAGVLERRVVVADEPAHAAPPTGDHGAAGPHGAADGSTEPDATHHATHHATADATPDATGSHLVVTTGSFPAVTDVTKAPDSAVTVDEDTVLLFDFR